MEVLEKQIKHGYKQTKLGWIPEDWEVKRLGDHITTFSGGTPKSTSSKYYSDNKGYPWISSGFLNEGTVTQTNIFITEEGLANSSAKIIEPETLLLALYGATAGVIAVSKITGAINQAVLAIKCSEKLNRDFLAFYLKHNKERLVLKYTQGGQPNLSAKNVKGYDFPLPPLLEQQKIAQVLSTWDKAIAKTEQLISQKQKRKQGLIQQLLTGKKRFKEFVKSDKMKETKLGEIPEDWEVITLGDKGVVVSGLTYKPEDIKSTGTIVLRSSNIQKGRLTFDNNVFIDKKNHIFNEVKEGDILICVRNGSKNLIGKNTLITKSLEGEAFGAFMTVFRTSEYEYFNQLFKTHYWNKEIHKNLGATINSINGGNLKKFRFPIPVNQKEQQKIASALSTADEEINKIQSHLKQLKLQKKGLMQKLLTGEVRVKID